jgi:hypothetical protein
MEKCPNCRGQFLSKNGLLLVNYEGQNQRVCPPCYEYLNYKQMQLEKKQEKMIDAMVKHLIELYNE